ncbi:MAG: FkbM family methyltransferase [Bacteroidia bacterium]|jgi:FkbM family methyltransferase
MDFRLSLLHILKDKWENIETLNSAINEHPKHKESDFFCIQIGANDGKLDDPIFKFWQKYRWRGLLVEPQKEMFERLKLNYLKCENIIFEQCAVSHFDGNCELFKIAKENRSDWHTGIATLTPDKGDLHFENKVKGKNLEIEMVAVRTLKSITTDHCIRKAHLIIIDTEGHEFEILNSVGFFDTSPDIIHYEHKHLSFVEQDKCLKLLSANGYKMYCGKWETTALRR